MLPRMLLLFVLMVTTTLFATGAWFGSLPPSAQNSDTDFVPQDVPLDDAILGSGLDAPQLLEKVLDNLRAKHADWLKTKIRQTVRNADGHFVADGWLQRGPHHCVRLEMDVQAGTTKGRLVTVSDGTALAEVRTLPGAPPAALIEKLPAAGQARDAYLIDKGCGGPAPLLRQLRGQLRNGTVRTGLLQGTHVIRIEGEVDAGAAPAAARGAASKLVVCAYVDVTTLWPLRCEWHKPGTSSAPVLRIDFSDAEIGRPLSLEACADVFSYRPTGAERVTSRQGY